MTTSAVVPTPSPVVNALRGSGAADSRAPGTDANSFDRQLGTARQQLAPSREQAPSHDSRAASARQRYASADAAPDHARKLAGKPTTSPTATPASDPTDPATQTAALTAAAPLGSVPGDSADADADAGDSVKAADTAVADTAAASLAGAMLALLPSANAALQTLSGGSGAAASGKSAAIGSGQAGAPGQDGTSLLPMGDAGASALTAASDAFVAGKADLSTLAAGVLPSDNSARDSSSPGQASAMLAAPSAASTTAPALLQMQAPVGSPTFGQELGQQVAWLGGQAGQGIKQASIRLNPQDLGPLDVKVSLNQGRVDVVFNAQHPAAVTAVQQTLPHLDHLLAQHGLSLGHAEVGQQQNRSDRQDTRGHGGQLGAGSNGDDVQASAAVSSISVGTVGLLDAFA